MKYWLMKTEPDVYSFADFFEETDNTAEWEGVRNYQARNFMRDEMQVGDQVFIYHCNSKPPGIVGIAQIVKAAYPDPHQFDPASKYFDPKSDIDNPRWLCVDIQALRYLERQLSLAELKTMTELSDMRLLQRGNRLSVMPVEEAEFNFILQLAKQEMTE